MFHAGQEVLPPPPPPPGITDFWIFLAFTFRPDCRGGRPKDTHCRPRALQTAVHYHADHSEHAARRSFRPPTVYQERHTPHFHRPPPLPTHRQSLSLSLSLSLCDLFMGLSLFM
jgi:hypothetical protein